MSYEMTEQDKKEYEQWLSETYKTADDDVDYKQWLYDCVEEVVDDLWHTHVNNWEFETEEDYAPYGDTFVGTGSYITDEEEDKCREYFKGNVDVNEVCKALLRLKSFGVCIKQIVDNVAEDSEIDV